MTVEELRTLYQKEKRQFKANNSPNEYDDIYPTFYSDWLEQKLTQPCPECWLEKSKREHMQVLMEEYKDEYLEHKIAVDKFVDWHVGECDDCPIHYTDFKRTRDYKCTETDCEGVIRRWAYSEGEYKK